ncbi:MAG TPA: PD-(D/E)XK nuclease family protein [Candidatus Saccharimonadales bacterium]|jgi:hypothetical protein
MAELPQFVSIAPDGVAEYYLDHTLLSTLRACESKFTLDFVENYRGRGLPPWALHFGSLFHECMEDFYGVEIKRNQGLLEMSDSAFVADFIARGAARWRDYNMETFSQLPQYKRLNGFPGFLTLLGQYCEYYRREFNKLKPVALEIAFGRNKEVPLLEDAKRYHWAPFRLYYAGRMDYIFDDGISLGPLDHKTFSRTDKNPITGYEVQEGMTGYVYSMQHVYASLKTTLAFAKNDKNETISIYNDYNRRTDVVWMNFIGVPHDTDYLKRFQRIPLYKTPAQLEDWKMRQISSTAKLHQVLFDGRPPDFNANVCTNYFYGTCPYQQVHRQASVANQLIVLKNHFTQEKKEWNPEADRSSALD